LLISNLCPHLTLLLHQSEANHFEYFARNKVVAIAINNAAGVPLPDTSPNAKQKRFSSIKNKSYKSPPTSFAGELNP
jgi:hypothetical protein